MTVAAGCVDHRDQRVHRHDRRHHRPVPHDGGHPRRAAGRACRRSVLRTMVDHARSCTAVALLARVPPEGLGRGLARRGRHRRGVLVRAGLAVGRARAGHQERRRREQLDPADRVPAAVPVQRVRAGRGDARRACAGSPRTSRSPRWWTPCARCCPARRPGIPATWPWPGARRSRWPVTCGRGRVSPRPPVTGCRCQDDWPGRPARQRAGRRPPRMITIGQLADYAGVTVKAVRHYHERGLLRRAAAGLVGLPALHRPGRHQTWSRSGRWPRPGCRSPGSRSCSPPSPGTFAAAIAEIDRDLPQGQASCAAPASGSRSSAAVTGCSSRTRWRPSSSRLRELGVSARGVQMERDMWILLQSVSPKARPRSGSPTSGTRSTIRSSGPSTWSTTPRSSWSPDDPRLPALAGRAHRWLAARAAGAAGPAAAQAARAAVPALDPAVTELIESSATASPGWERLAELGRELRTGESDPAGPSQ